MPMLEQLELNTQVEEWPAEAQEAIVALESAFPPYVERRTATRQAFRTIAPMRLDDSHPEADPNILFSRDINPWQMGFITNCPLENGRRGVVTLETEDGRCVDVACTIRRCREYIDGWFEGVINFRHEQPSFA